MKNIKLSESSEAFELSALVNKYSSFLNEIRKRILFTLAVFAVSTLVGFIFYERIIKFLINIFSLKGVNIVFTSPFQFINLSISCGIATGLFFVFPLLVYQIFSFLKPALRVKEFKMLVRFLPFSIILFLTGFLFGFYIMKWQIEIFLAKSISLGIGNILDISSLLSVILLTSILMGIGFQFPIVMFFLMRIGIIKHNQISKQRLWVYLGSFIFAILLPADSIIADGLFTLPLIIMFELTLFLDRIFQRKKNALA